MKDWMDWLGDPCLHLATLAAGLAIAWASGFVLSHAPPVVKPGHPPHCSVCAAAARQDALLARVIPPPESP